MQWPHQEAKNSTAQALREPSTAPRTVSACSSVSGSEDVYSTESWAAPTPGTASSSNSSSSGDRDGPEWRPHLPILGGRTHQRVRVCDRRVPGGAAVPWASARWAEPRDHTLSHAPSATAQDAPPITPGLEAPPPGLVRPLIPPLPVGVVCCSLLGSNLGQDLQSRASRFPRILICKPE
jgi:hypothetical protein